MHFQSLLFASARVVKATGSRLVNKPGAGARHAISLTTAAVTRVKELIARNPDAKALKIGVKQRGCNGFTYTLEYAKEKGKFDEEVVQDGAHIWIDSKAQLTLIGSEMDFVQSKLAAEFVFYNPNIKNTCGCGESFNMNMDIPTAITNSHTRLQSDNNNSAGNTSGSSTPVLSFSSQELQQPDLEKS